jgi:hypothetical protein
MDLPVRLLNDDDLHTFAWLQAHAGRSRVAAAARRLTLSGRPAYVSALCRYLGVWPPARSRAKAVPAVSAVADLHLARMRAILSQRGAGAPTPVPNHPLSFQA